MRAVARFVAAALVAACAGCGAPPPIPADASACPSECPPPLVCSADTGECIECETNDDCARGRCSENRCVACVDDADCTAGLPRCVASACTQCASPADCTRADRSYCDERGSCAACFFDEDCAHLDGTPLCEAGRCVACAARDERECAPAVCDVATMQCGAGAVRSRDACEPCVSDLECQEGQLCVRSIGTVAGAPNTRAHCVWRYGAEGLGGGDCFAARPAIHLVLATSVGGVTDGVCIPTRSCEGLRDFGTVSCGDGPLATPAPDATCGSGTDGALCAPLDAESNRCTVQCTGHVDCPCADASCDAHFACRSYGSGAARACDLTATCALSDASCL